MSLPGLPYLALTFAKLDRQQHSFTPISAFELISLLRQVRRYERCSGHLTKLPFHDVPPCRILRSRIRFPDVEAADPVRGASRHAADLVEPAQHDARRARSLGQDGQPAQAFPRHFPVFKKLRPATVGLEQSVQDTV